MAQWRPELIVSTLPQDRIEPQALVLWFLSPHETGKMLINLGNEFGREIRRAEGMRLTVSPS